MMARSTKLERRLRFMVLGLAGLLLLLGLPLAWYLGSPLFLNQMVDEAAPTGVVATQPVGTAPAAGTGATGAGSAPAPAAAAAGAIGGRFVDADGSHKGEGRVMIITQADGRRILRFEDFRVTNGPDLYVYFSGHPAPRNTDQLHAAGDFEVARLKGNMGNQNYELPADLDLSQFKSVVIYCKRFTTVFSTAELAAGAATGGERATLPLVVGEG